MAEDMKTPAYKCIQQLILLELATASYKSARPEVYRTAQLRMQQLSEAALREERLDRDGLGTMFVDNAKCICGEYLAVCDEGDFVCVMFCCFRRIHAGCLRKWGAAIKKAREEAERELIIYGQAEAVVRHVCECGSDQPEKLSRVDLDTVMKERQSFVAGKIHAVREFDRLADMNPELISGGSDGIDRSLNVDRGIKGPPRLTDMAWESSGPRFWLWKP